MSFWWHLGAYLIVALISGGIAFFMGYSSGRAAEVRSAREADEAMIAWERDIMVRMIQHVVNGDFPEDVETIRLWGRDIRIRPEDEE